MPAEKFSGVTEYQDYHEEPPTDEQKMYGPFNIKPAETVAQFEALKTSERKEGKKLEGKDDAHK